MATYCEIHTSVFVSLSYVKNGEQRHQVLGAAKQCLTRVFDSTFWSRICTVLCWLVGYPRGSNEFDSFEQIRNYLYPSYSTKWCTVILTLKWEALLVETHCSTGGWRTWSSTYTKNSNWRCSSPGRGFQYFWYKKSHQPRYIYFPASPLVTLNLQPSTFNLHHHLPTNERYVHSIPFHVVVV